MSEFSFVSVPNIWGDPEDPPYQYVFSRSEVIGDTTYVLIVNAGEIATLPLEEWYDYLQSAWSKHIKDSQP